MNFRYFLSSCISVLIIFSIIEVGRSLDCFHCNVTTVMMNTASTEHPVGSVTAGYDPCAGIAKLQKCQDPAVCIAATYSYKDASSPGTTTTLMSCYLNMAGNECENFMKNVKNINHASPQMAFSESCVACTTNGCNHTPKQSSIPPQQSQAVPRSEATVVTVSTAVVAFASLATRIIL